jgi:hypothetical protein
VASAAEVMSAKTAMSEMMSTAAVTHMEAVMAASVVSSAASRFGDERHCECRH